MSATLMRIGDTVSISLDAAITVGGSLIALWAAGEVVEVREKAIKLLAQTKTGKAVSCWLPRKAMVPMGKGRVNPFDNHMMYCCTLARWFHLDHWTGSFLRAAADTDITVSA